MIKKYVWRERARERGKGRGAERELKTIQQSEINEATQSTNTRTDGHNSHTHKQGLKKEDAIPNPQRYSPFSSENQIGYFFSLSKNFKLK